MNRMLSGFLDRLTERLTAVIAGVVSSKVESIRAVAQADQQAQLEDLARQYETDGKHDVARILRDRAQALTSVNLAGDAVDMMQVVSSDTPRLMLAANNPPSESAPRLPDFASAPPRERKKKSLPSKSVAGTESNPESGS